MNVEQLLSIVEETASANRISKPFIVGGIPRDRILGSRGKKTELNDIDITTGDDGSVELGRLLSVRFPDSNYRTYDDGHSSIDIGGLHIDFSSNFVAHGVENELKRKGVQTSNMKLELYSRDFTINTLLESLDFEAIYDITGEAIGDIQAGIIKCPVDPEITIGADPRRILRAVKFSIKYGFNIEDSLKTTMFNMRKKIENLPVKFVQDKLNEIVGLDNDAIDVLLKYKLLSIVPLTKTISDILIQRRQLVRAL